MKAWRKVLSAGWCVAMLALSAAFAPTVSAQTFATQAFAGISEITAFGGLTMNGDNEATAGVALTFNMTPQMGLEGEIGVIFADDEVITASGNAVLNLGYGTSYIVPYLTGGAGIMKNGGTEIALNLGAGLKIFLEPSMAFRGDFRVFLTTEGGDVHDLERFYGGLEFLF